MSKIEVTLGIDIGGTNTAFGFVDRQGKMIASGSIPTKAEEPAEKLFERLFTGTDELFINFNLNYQVVGIGIGAPNANYYHGTVETPPNLSWDTVNILDIVKKYSPLPSVITNDANAAAIGEMEFGAAKGMKDFIVITLGTGLGSGIVVNGRLVYGHDGFAGEIGHTVYDPDGRQCGCGRKGCLETYASATGLVRTVAELLCNSTADSELRELKYNEITAKIVHEAAKRGDKIALDAFEETGKILGAKLADSVAHTSPEAIILFGGVANAGEYIFEPTKRHMELNMLGVFRNKVKLLPSSLTDGNTAVLGAAALIWNEIEK